MLVVCSRAFWLNKLVSFCYDFKSSSMLISHTLHRLFPARIQVLGALSLCWDGGTVPPYSSSITSTKSVLQRSNTRTLSASGISQNSSSCNTAPTRVLRLPTSGESCSSLRPRVRLTYMHYCIRCMCSRMWFEQILSNLVSRRLAVAKELLSFVIDKSDPPEYTWLAVEMEGYSPVDMRDLVTQTIQVVVGRAVSEGGMGTW